MKMQDERKSYSEEHTLKYQGRTKAGKRYMYQFENPKNAQYPLKFAVFPPGEPTLKEDTFYTFTSYNSPNTKGDGYFHNLARVCMDGEYKIQEATAEEIAKLNAEASAKASKEKTENAEPEQEKKEVDWDGKERRIVRENCMSQANEMIKTLLSAGHLTNTAQAGLEKQFFRIAEDCEKWVYREEKLKDIGQAIAEISGKKNEEQEALEAHL
jgi:hypothetical protein